MNENAVISPNDSNVVFGHKIRRTCRVKWLCLVDIYQKFYRPNYYDIGGTYMGDVTDYWLTYKTEQNATNFLLHLFITNHCKGTIRVAVSSTNYITLNSKHNFATLLTHLKEYQFDKVPDQSFNYITTYCFTDLDVETLRNKNLYIAVSFPHVHKDAVKKDIIDTLKAEHHFGSLLHDPVGADFTIESDDGELFKAHRALLSAHCDYFKAMLKQDTAESQNGYVKLIGVGAEEVKSILEFIYTGFVKGIEHQNCYNLMLLADSYNLKGLRELINHVLILQLSVDNAIEIVSVADLSNSEEVKIAAFKFIKKNLSVLETSAYQEMNNAVLVKELCQFLCLPQ